MKPSARVALIVALATTTPTWASLPFYSPDYTHMGGYQFAFTGGVTPDGKAAGTMRHSSTDDYLIVTWRGQTPLPMPQTDSGHFNPFLRGMNRDGWIFGTTERPLLGPALWRPDGSRIDLPLLPSFPDEPGGTVGMNDSGIVVGWAGRNYESKAQLGAYPVYWTSSHEIIELTNPFATSKPFGRANKVSSNGIIAGVVYDESDNRHAMRWDINGTAPILSQTTDTGITYARTEAYESLEDGTILGWGSNISYIQSGILWTPDGEAIDLRALPGSSSQEVRWANGINDSHYSVGAGRNSLGQRVGVRWSPIGEPFALDRLPDAPSNADHDASDINDFNFATGTSRSPTGTFSRAVLWTPDGDVIDLNSLVESNAEWNLNSVGPITNTGWIYGVADYDPAGPTASYRRPFTILVPFAGTYGMGDANFDESIDFADLLIVAQNYGTETNGSFDVGDFNLDGSVNFTDLLAIAQNYGTVLGDVFTMLPNSPNPTFESDWQAARGMVPEPSVTGLMIGVGLMVRRRVGPAPVLPNAP